VKSPPAPGGGAGRVKEKGLPPWPPFGRPAPAAAVAPPAGRDPPRPVAIAPARRCRRPAVGGAGQRPPEASGPPRAAPEDLAAITLFSYYVIIMAILNLTERTSGFSEDFRGFSGFLACVACPAHGRLVFRIGASAAPKRQWPARQRQLPAGPAPVESTT